MSICLRKSEFVEWVHWYLCLLSVKAPLTVNDSPHVSVYSHAHASYIICPSTCLFIFISTRFIIQISPLLFLFCARTLPIVPTLSLANWISQFVRTDVIVCRLCTWNGQLKWPEVFSMISQSAVSCMNNGYVRNWIGGEFLKSISQVHESIESVNCTCYFFLFDWK